MSAAKGLFKQAINRWKLTRKQRIILGNAAWGSPMNARSAFLLAAFAIVAAPRPVSAHHSFAAEYDSNKPITVTGTVTKLEWTNPHGRVYVDAKDASGNIVHWDFELGPPTALMRRGWTRTSLKPGHVVTVSGFLSKT